MTGAAGVLILILHRGDFGAWQGSFKYSQFTLTNLHLGNMGVISIFVASLTGFLGCRALGKKLSDVVRTTPETTAKRCSSVTGGFIRASVLLVFPSRGPWMLLYNLRSETAF